MRKNHKASAPIPTMVAIRARTPPVEPNELACSSVVAGQDSHHSPTNIAMNLYCASSSHHGQHHPAASRQTEKITHILTRHLLAIDQIRPPLPLKRLSIRSLKLLDPRVHALAPILPRPRGRLTNLDEGGVAGLGPLLNLCVGGVSVRGSEEGEGRGEAYPTGQNGELDEGGVVGAGAGVDGTKVVAEYVGDVAGVGSLHDELLNRGEEIDDQLGSVKRRGGRRNSR